MAIERRLLRGLRLSPIAAVLSLPIVPSAQAAPWQFVPSVEVRDTWSDNARLRPDGQASADNISEVLPGFVLSTDGPRLKVKLDYSLDALTYQREHDQDTLLHNLQGQLNGELIANWLFLDATALMAQANINAFGPEFIDDTSATSNRAQVRATHISPYLRHRLGTWATMEVRYARERFSSSDNALASSSTDRVSATLASGSAFSTLGWGAHYNAERTSYAGSDSLNNSNYGVDLRYALWPTLALTASAGYERYGYAALLAPAEGASWLAGFDWHPSSRTTLDVSVGHRYYGSTYALSASLRGRRTVALLSYNEDVTTTQAQFLGSQSVNTSDFLDKLWTTSIPDAAARRDAIAAFIADTGLPATISGAVNEFSNRYFLQKTLQGSLALQGARHTGMLTVYSSRRSPQSASLLADDPTAGAALDDGLSTRQLGLQGLWRWSVTAHTAATLSLGADRATTDGSGASSRDISLRLALNHQLSRHLHASFEVRNLRQRSSNSAVRENALAVGLRADF